MSRRIQSAVDAGTPYFFQVMNSIGNTVRYRGFIEVRRLDRLNFNGSKGLIVVQNGASLRWFLYDKDYPDAVRQLVGYWNDTYDTDPIYKKLDYKEV